MASPDSVSKKASRVEQEVENEGTEGRSSRGKRGKNGAKKLPQRGLGVAQLEKLRLQEQKLQETACFAATRGLHETSFSASVALAEKGIPYGCSYPGKFEFCTDKRGTNLLSFCKVLPNPHQTTTMPISTALMSAQDQGSSNGIIHSNYKDKALIYADLISASTLNQPSGSSPSSILAGHAEGHEPAQSSFSRAVDTSSLDSCLSSSVSIREQSNGKSTFFQKENGTVGTTEGDAAKILALSTLDTLSVSSISAFSKGFLDRGLSSQRLLFHFQSAAMMDKNSEHGQGVQEPFPSSLPAGESSKGLAYNGFLKGSALCNPENNGGGSLSNLQLLNSSFEPPDKNYSAVDQLHLPMGISSFGDLPKELSSFQNCSSSQGRTSAEKSSERKRPWLATQHPASLEIKFKDLGSNGLREFNGHIDHQILKAQTSDCEATHLTSRVFLHDLGDSAIPYLKINSCISAPICQESHIPFFTSGFFPDPLLFLDLKRNGGSKNGYPTHNPTKETSSQTISADKFLSLGPSSMLASDFCLHNLGGSEDSSLRHNCRELQVMTSQQDSVDQWKSNVSFANERTDVPLSAHPFIPSSLKGKLPGIMANGKSEDLRLEEQGRPGASNQLQSLDLSLKLAL